MRPTARPLVAAAALVGLAAVPVLAHAASPDTHVMTMQLPDGMTAQIQYTGDTPPTIALSPAADPFALFERQAAAMFQAFDTIAFTAFPAFGGLTEAALPSGGDFCARSVQITFGDAGQAPRVVSHTAGNCGPAQQTAAPAAIPAPEQPSPAQPSIQVRDQPYQGLVRHIDWRR